MKAEGIFIKRNYKTPFFSGENYHAHYSWRRKLCNVLFTVKLIVKRALLCKESTEAGSLMWIGM